VENGVFVACRSKIVVDFLSNEIEVNLLVFYPMRLKLTSSHLSLSRGCVLCLPRATCDVICYYGCVVGCVILELS
jgi:hypothetical protein